ncbi:hypothetical protein D8B26_000124 [Coccidioides posadasii str. Silveira]|uniref:X-Pro dipeptidyl-peptidase n=1 Tax=Coccidioides posadasii (strain RMSCC 757 / Silveira) TaxID=443226 RepID=E9D7N5_COCPS|nr:X-Pro dipeptidyl-peptidase [Coccidioides posadasii str. Silveira]QVM05413.1 hypothetical protein D8B26_000124 [Coccidioides posadasii str. Silveira]
MVKRIVQHPLSICRPVVQQPIDHGESIQHRIVRVTEDIECLKRFYSIDISPTTVAKLKKYYHEELGELEALPFQSYNQEDKIDFLLLSNFLRRSLRRLELDETRIKKMDPLLRPFAPSIIQLCEDRQKVVPVDGQVAAQRLEDISKAITSLMTRLEKGDIEIDKFSAFRAASAVEQLQHSLAEWFSFYEGYEPLLTWWTSQPHSQVIVKLEDLAAAIRRNIVGLDPDEEDPIVGQPIGYEGLLADLEAEVIPYTPEELITIGEKEYIWCEREMKNASRELGFGEDWRRALEYVKNLYVSPGQQPQLVRKLADEAIEYVTKNDLVTVPPLAAETWRTFMMSPSAQKVAPFFLGGESIRVSFPTSSMDHNDKLMSLRSNNVHFSRATVFHELIPGHHLQLYMASRYRPYRQLFTTPFWIEGGALYWEMTFWDRGFPQSPENRIGMLFWRMHRCARIIFSLKFHMGQMTPQECIDFLVSRVGHERATAEGEVRRSFNGDYSPLYQAGYMLGALQLRSLRREIVDSGIIGEKEFHDWILRENQMPIEFLRAIMQDLPLTPEYKPSWKFYG